MLGADPELFLQHAETKEFISAEGIVGGTKYEPKSLGVDGFCVQEDNVMVEFNIPPASTPEEFSTNIQTALGMIRSIVPQELVFSKVASADFDDRFLQSEQALTFGCDPDFSGWTENQNDTPSPCGNMRTAGGHIHISYPNPEIDTTLRFLKLVDLFVGIPSIIFDPDTRRKEMYGKAGAFRFKKFGFEYRSLSNFWIWSEDHTKMVFKQVLKAFKELNTGKIDTSSPELKELIISAINHNRRDIAEDLIKRYNIL